MEFTIKRGDFLDLLLACQGVIPAKGPKAILSYCLLKATSDGITITATDLDNTIIAQAPANIAREGAVAILAKKLLEIVRELPESDVFVSKQ